MNIFEFILKTTLKRQQVQILKVIERVLNQNRYQELIYSKKIKLMNVSIHVKWFSFLSCIDFKYFEDANDEQRDPKGTLLPLWKFPPTLVNRSVTALTWNPAYSDMLLIGYGLCITFIQSRMT